MLHDFEASGQARVFALDQHAVDHQAEAFIEAEVVVVSHDQTRRSPSFRTVDIPEYSGSTTVRREKHGLRLSLCILWPSASQIASTPRTHCGLGGDFLSWSCGAHLGFRCKRGMGADGEDGQEGTNQGGEIAGTRRRLW